MKLDSLNLWNTQILFFLLFFFTIMMIGTMISNKLGVWSTGLQQKNGSSSFNSFFLRSFFSLTLGLFTVITVLFIFGVFGLLYPAVIFFVLSVLLVISFVSIYKTNNGLKNILLASFFRIEKVLFLLLLVSTVIASIKVPGAWDDTMYHLPLARHYVQTHNLSLNEFYRLPLSPQNYDLLFSFSLMFGNELLAQLIATLPLMLISLGLIGLVLWTTNSMFLAVLATLFSLVTAPLVIGYAYIDNGLSLFSFAMLLAVICFSVNKERLIWIWVAGVFAGASVGTKYFGVLCVGSVVLWLMLEKQWKALFIFIFMTICFGSWWYIRSFIISGDPIHPLGYRWFGYFLWNAQDIQTLVTDQRSYIKTQNPFMLFLVLNLHEISLPFFAIACLALARTKQKVIRLLQIAFVIHFAFWFFSNQITRYVSVLFPIGAFLLVYLVWVIWQWMIQKRGISFLSNFHLRFLDPFLAVILLVPLPVMAYYQETKMHLHLGLDSILKSKPDAGYLVFSKANSLIPKLGQNILQLGLEQGVYFFKGQAKGDWFGPVRYQDFLDCELSTCQLISAKQMIEKMNQLDTRMLAISFGRFGKRIPIEYFQYFTILAEDQNSILLTPK